jgi:hypothetical protein
LPWTLNAFAEDNVGILKSNIISFSLDPLLSIVPREGQILIEEDQVRLDIEKVGLGCMATNCHPVIAIKQTFAAPMVEIYQDECKNIHYKAFKSDALANDQEIYIEIIDYAKNICPVYISNSPTEVILKTTYTKGGENEKVETKSKMTAELLIEKIL